LTQQTVQNIIPFVAHAIQCAVFVEYRGIMIKETAYAKINIGLDIVEKRSDGYHNIDTIMQAVSLGDEIYLKKALGITIECSNTDIPIDESNTAHKAAIAFFKKSNIDYQINGVSISIIKHIPSKAGLGGGSSDAAAVLRGLNKLYCTNFSTSILRELALEVGSDVPFCIEGGTQRAKGRGEELTVLPSFKGVNIVIIMPAETVETAYAYSMHSKTEEPVHPNMQLIETVVLKKNLHKLGNCIGNTFEPLVFPGKPTIEKAKHDIIDTGAVIVSMTGSGAAVFGVYDSHDTAQTAYLKLNKKYKTYLTKTIGGID